MAHKNKMIRCELVNHYDIASQAALVVKNLPASAGETRLWFSGRSPGEGKGYLLQYSSLENPMDRGAWRVQSLASQRVGHNWVTEPMMDGASQVVLVLRNTPANAGDVRNVDSISGSGRFPGGGHGNPPTPGLLPGECPSTGQPGELQLIGSQMVRHH